MQLTTPSPQRFSLEPGSPVQEVKVTAFDKSAGAAGEPTPAKLLCTWSIAAGWISTRDQSNFFCLCFIRPGRVQGIA